MKTDIKKIYWCVLYANGARAYFASRENAMAEAAMHGIGIRAPLYAQ